jgi:hypothetical protein
MQVLRISLLSAIILIVSILAVAQDPGYTQSSPPNQTIAAPSSDQSEGTTATSAALEIVSPKANENVVNSAITVRYDLLDSGVTASASPIYRLRLDGRDPVETTSNSYNFAGLKPGNHVLAVELVDANHTPILGSGTAVHFTSSNQPPAATGQQSPATPPQSQQSPPQQQSPQVESQPPSIHKANLPLPAGNGSGELPSAGGELPLLSMVGFGVLVGGLISAMRTRRQ